MSQTIAVIYQNERYIVDQSQLKKASRIFHDLAKKKKNNNQNLVLKIRNTDFKSKNISDFLSLCQNKNIEIQKKNLEEICLIAKMFQADKIFDKYYNLIKNNNDSNNPNLEDKFEERNGNQCLILEEDTEYSSYITRNDSYESEYYNISEDIESNSDGKNNNDQNKKHRSVCYQIKADNPFMKSHRFYLMKDDKIIYMAKRKYDDIYIGEGDEVHIKDKHKENEHSAQIKRDNRGFNIVKTNDQEFKIKFIRFGEKNSMKVSFEHKGQKCNWSPLQAKDAACFNGEYDHVPAQSNKNIILQNARNHPTFILRKMSKNCFEAECHQNINPVIAFALAISEISGPIGF
ncbi:hypothetical protein M9Y10_003509 [Tritrichomonas musculus]|uniref:BTB domain-containing protein n=1 Tax=Tritrichomonas musculus TaxID=1915356 RepID=A0ABR2JRH0_9EUKA